MKKVISVATTAAMTLSMLSVPAIVFAAEETAAAPVSLVIADQTIEKGLSSFTVPVSLSQNTSVSDAEIKFSTVMYPGGRYVAKITAVESAVEGVTVTEKDGTVTVSGSADVKKNQTVFNITVKIYDKNGNEATTIPENSNFKLSVDSAKIGDVVLSDEAKEEASAYLFVKPAETTKDFSFVMGSVNTTSKTVKVPVTVNGSLGALSTRFRASNGAVVSSVEVVDGLGIDLSEDGKGFVYAPLSAESDRVFDNEVVAYINVTLPEDAVSGQSFKITTKFIDAYTFDDKNLYPETLEDSDIIYVMKGDANLSNSLEQLDATLMLKEALSQDVSKTTILEAEYNKIAEKNEEVKATIDNCTVDKLIAAATYAMDLNGDNAMTGLDATYLLRYCLNRDVTGEDKSLDDYLAEIKK